MTYPSRIKINFNSDHKYKLFSFSKMNKKKCVLLIKVNSFEYIIITIKALLIQTRFNDNFLIIS